MNFGDILMAMVETGATIAIGAFIYHIGVLSYKSTKELGGLIVNVTYPLLIFVNIIRHFPEVGEARWYLLPVYEYTIIFGSFLIAYLYLLFDRSIRYRKEFLFMVSFQNTSFLPLVIIANLFPEDIAGKYFIYVFLFDMFFGAGIISTAKILFLKDGRGFEWRKLITPPLIAVLSSLFLIYTGGSTHIPDIILNICYHVGNISIPLSLLVLGGIIYFSIKENPKIDLSYALKGSFLKLIVIPLIALLVIKFVPMSDDLKFLIIIEAAVPTAMNVTILSRLYGGNYQIQSQATVVMYLLSLITLPVFVMFAMGM